MDENHQVKAGSNLTAIEGKLSLPPLSSKDQKEVDRLQKKGMEAGNKWRWGFSDKTGWDWLQILLQLLTALALPVALFLAAQWFSAQQSQASALASDKQHRTDLQIAQDQQRETTLKTYLDDMSDLLLNHNLHKSKPGDEVSQVARERTLTTLRRLDANRNGIVLQFLQDAQLISGKNAVIDFLNADLSNDDLRGVNLRGANLRGADLSFANLSGADLRGADLSFSFANPSGADLSFANLSGANLYDAILERTHLRGAFLNKTKLFKADLSGADLSEAHLYGAYLRGANLSGADLSGAGLFGADLSFADLSTAKVTQEQLNEAASLQGTIMPNRLPHP